MTTTLGNASLFALTTLLLVRIANPEATAEGAAAKGSLWRETTYGWRYIAARPGLLGLLIFFAITNLGMGIVQVLITPLVLGFAKCLDVPPALNRAGLARCGKRDYFSL